MRILITGGLGYIGTHVAHELHLAGHSLVLVDNLSNSTISTLTHLEKLIGSAIEFHQIDVRNSREIQKILIKKNIEVVVHMAAAKSVPESLQMPLDYFDNNVNGLISLLSAMDSSGCHRIIFSSSAVVYGESAESPIGEEALFDPTNPYAESKVMCEQVLKAAAASNDQLQFGILRYFNPIGAHESGLIGESPTKDSVNVMPTLIKVASGQRDFFTIFGDTYDTRDGTPIRDYIHVKDLATGHLKSLESIELGYSHVVNLGSGSGHTVLELAKCFESVLGETLPIEIGPPRNGDVAVSYTDTKKASELLGWRATRTLREMCASAWNRHLRMG